jgi:hypothetical protein
MISFKPSLGIPRMFMAHEGVRALKTAPANRQFHVCMFLKGGLILHFM